MGDTGVDVEVYEASVLRADSGAICDFAENIQKFNKNKLARYLKKQIIDELADEGLNLKSKTLEGVKGEIIEVVKLHPKYQRADPEETIILIKRNIDQFNSYLE